MHEHGVNQICPECHNTFDMGSCPRCGFPHFKPCTECGDPQGLPCICGKPVCYDCAKDMVINGEHTPVCLACYNRGLGIVTIGKEHYFIDYRLKQIRNVNNPHDFKPLCEGCNETAESCEFFCDPFNTEGDCLAMK